MQIRPKKSLGQHFLVGQHYPRRILKYAEIHAQDHVVEIGPGTGELTSLLLQTARKVTAVEFDRDMIRLLLERFPHHPRLRLLQANILRIEWGDIIGEDTVKLVGNLPYNISTRIILKTIPLRGRLQSFTLMAQREVARRILAEPGEHDYGYFSVVVGYYFKTRAGFDVPPGAFVPPPKVVSHVLQLIPRRTPPVISSSSRFLKLLKHAFEHPRKTIANNLRREYGSLEHCRVAMEGCGVCPDQRPHQLTVEQYACLSRML
ncbi:MAG: ribosomal RNA small subunit methyltransferase A [Acidobacteria bacterium]|nr:ribosomal RNA small subunit methyltransferase A [Acidobacteriota bacterium]